MRVKSFAQLRRLKLKLKRDESMQVQRVGSHYKARFRGSRNAVFGATREEAIDRLRKASSESYKDSATNAATAERNWLYGYRAAEG